MQVQGNLQARNSNTNNKKRIYFSMLELVGTRGKYQYLMMFFIFIIGMESSACFLVNPYLFYEQSFNCPKEITKCKQFVCSLPQDARAAYTPPFNGKISLATQLKSKCESQQFILLLNSSIILGSVVGIFSAIFFTQWLGRRWTVILSLITSVLGLLLCLIHSSIIAVIGVFFYGAGLDISYSCIYTLITEFFAENDRGFFYNIISLSFAAGILINPLAFYYIDNWKIISITFFILPIIVAILGFVFWVEDTPIELVAYKKPEQILAAFQRIAKRNSVVNHGLTIEAVRQIKEEYDENQRIKHSRVFSIIDICKFESLRAHVIPLGALKFVMMFIFYAPGILLDQFAMNIYVNGLVNGLSQLAGIPLQLWLLQFPRKYVTYILFASSAVFAVAMSICKQLCTDCNGETTIAQGTFLFLYRICCTIASFIVVVMLNQTYPAQVRNLAVFINISFGRSATLLVPFVSRFCQFTHIPFLILLALSSILGMGVTSFAQETFGILPPEMIKEVQIQSHNYRHYQLIDTKKPKSLLEDKET